MAINSFTSDVMNPITDARIGVSMSGPGLAKRLGLSRQYINRAEQGTYSSLNPDLVRWTAEALGVDVRSVVKLYNQFQKATREATVEKVEPHKLERHGSQPGHVIFERWRSGYWTSPTQFAVAFCVHPDSVQKYEEGIQKTMPGQIQNALREVNLLADNFEKFDRGASEGKALSGRLTA